MVFLKVACLLYLFALIVAGRILAYSVRSKKGKQYTISSWVGVSIGLCIEVSMLIYLFID